MITNKAILKTLASPDRPFSYTTADGTDAVTDDIGVALDDEQTGRPRAEELIARIDVTGTFHMDEHNYITAYHPVSPKRRPMVTPANKQASIHTYTES